MACTTSTLTALHDMCTFILLAQTPSRGNALQACVACALELELDKVPNFIADDDPYASLRAFLKKFGLGFLKVRVPSAEMNNLLPHSDVAKYFHPSIHVIPQAVKNIKSHKFDTSPTKKNRQKKTTCNLMRIRHEPLHSLRILPPPAHLRCLNDLHVPI